MAEPHAKLAKQNKICYSSNGTSRLPIKDYSKQNTAHPALSV